MAALFNFLLFYSLLSIGCSAFLIYHDPKMWKDYVEFNNMFDQYGCDSFLNFSFENPK